MLTENFLGFSSFHPVYNFFSGEKKSVSYDCHKS